MNMNSPNPLWMQASRNPFSRKILDALGLKVVPFYLFLERLPFVDLSHLDADFEAYDTGFFDEKDIRKIADIPGRQFSFEDLMARLKTGQVCYGMKYRGEIAAFTWCDVERSNSVFYNFSLAADEAYLFDAFTLAAYRGKGIAPYLRYRFYRELEKKNRFNFYSYSLYFNTPAVRFKEKLNARRLKLGVYVEVFHKWHFTFTLKRYRIDAFC